MMRFRRSLICVAALSLALLAPQAALAVPVTADLGIVAQTARLADWLLDVVPAPLVPGLQKVFAADGTSSGGSSGTTTTPPPDGTTNPDPNNPDDGGSGAVPDPDGYA